MDRIVDRDHAIRRRLGMLRCPDCFGSLGLDGGLSCKVCKRQFYNGGFGTTDLTPRTLSETKEKSCDFWGDTYQQWYESDDSARTPDGLKNELASLESLFRQRRHLAVTEMDLHELKGKEVLEIGSGAGGHAALFAQYGGHVTATDITPERVIATGNKLELLKNGTTGGGIAIRADAEVLPFADNSFDIVYSNGVLHHTEDTGRCIREAFRVLKPGGQAIIMLYARHSAYYWFKLVPLES